MALEIVSSYGYVAMMIERCIVVFFPIRSRTLVNTRFTIILLCICTLPFFAAIIPINWIYTEVKLRPNTIIGKSCGIRYDWPLADYLFYSSVLILYIIHIVITPFIIVVLTTKLIAHRRRRRHLVSTMDKNKGEQNAKTNSTLVIMLLLCSINFLIFAPYSSINTFDVMVGTSGWSQNAMLVYGDIMKFTGEVLCIAHSINFLVYFFRLSSFRTEMVKLFSCCFS